MPAPAAQANHHKVGRASPDRCTCPRPRRPRRSIARVTFYLPNRSSWPGFATLHNAAQRSHRRYSAVGVRKSTSSSMAPHSAHLASWRRRVRRSAAGGAIPGAVAPARRGTRGCGRCRPPGVRGRPDDRRCRPVCSVGGRGLAQRLFLRQQGGSLRFEFVVRHGLRPAVGRTPSDVMTVGDVVAASDDPAFVAPGADED